jgi:putative protein kinase ArgK-like GTPase of G3E family
MPKKEFVDDWFRKRKERKSHLTADDIHPSLIAGNRQALSAAITLIESNLSADRNEARKLLQQCNKLSRKSWRIGITGVPGVGKSTFIEAFGRLFIEQGLKVAVLAIDPSSNVTGGSNINLRVHWLGKCDEKEKEVIMPIKTTDTLNKLKTEILKKLKSNKAKECVLLYTSQYPCEVHGESGNLRMFFFFF